MAKEWITLRPLARLDDFALLAARLATGTFLIDGVWDNVTERVRMAEFVAFMRANGFVAPDLLAPFSVYAQLLAGGLLILGLLTRWAGLILLGNFVVALWMVHWTQTLREWWPALALIALGCLFATRGGGRYAVDALWEHR